MAPRKTPEERKAVIKAKADKVKEAIKRLDARIGKLNATNEGREATYARMEARMKAIQERFKKANAKVMALFAKRKLLVAKHDSLMKLHDAIGTETEKESRAMLRSMAKPRKGKKGARKPRASVKKAPAKRTRKPKTVMVQPAPVPVNEVVLQSPPVVAPAPKKKRTVTISDEERAKRSARMKALNARRRGEV